MKKYCVFVLLALISYSLSFAGPDNLNEKDPDGWFPLGLAAVRGDAATVGLLLDEGASLETYVESKGKKATPFILAAQRNHKEVMALILNSPQFTDTILAQEVRNAKIFKQPNLARQLGMLHRHAPLSTESGQVYLSGQQNSPWDAQANLHRILESMCAICMETPGDRGKTELIDGTVHTGDSAVTPCCGQTFCKECLEEGRRSNSKCPMCRAHLGSGAYQIIPNAIEAFSWKDLASWGSPPPIVAPQSGAIRLVSVASNDSRVTPAFAQLGEMHEIGGVIFSGARYVLSQAAGEEFCRNLGGGSYLPPIEELELFRRGLGYPNSYDGDQISNQAYRFFLSSSVHPDNPDFYYVLNGNDGDISSWSHYAPSGSVRCCVRAAERG
jgi:hypothetical protein